jgi:pyruvate/2-oxoglutarate dehydrogenase complex dihydrolipoamide acyltransferase (E2) component
MIMTRIPAAATIVSVSTVLLIAGVYAQTAPAPAPAPAPAVAAPAPAPAPPAPRAKSRTPNRADARVCLEFPTNLQVIQCSEKYRYAKG